MFNSLDDESAVGITSDGSIYIRIKRLDTAEMRAEEKHFGK